MKSSSQLREDIAWWEEEIRARKGKVEEAIRMRDTRKSELESALQFENSNSKKSN